MIWSAMVQSTSKTPIKVRIIQVPYRQHITETGPLFGPIYTKTFNIHFLMDGSVILVKINWVLILRRSGNKHHK